MLGQGSPNCSVDATMLQFCWSLHLGCDWSVNMTNVHPYQSVLNHGSCPFSLTVMDARRGIFTNGETFSTKFVSFVDFSHLEDSRFSPRYFARVFKFFNHICPFNRVYLGKIVILSSLRVTRRRKIRRSKRKVCTNLGNSTAPRCTSRFRDTGPPRKSRCVRPPNRNYDNCTCNRHVSRKVTPGDTDKSRRFDEMDLINENQWRR